MERVNKAMLFCKVAHNAVGQVRKYGKQPYWTHPVAVMKLVESVPHTEDQLVAALLHDVVEDTHITLEQITDEFGSEVTELVDWLTDRSTPEMGNRKVRKEYDRNRLAQAPAAVKTIKLADLIHNSGSISKHDPGFARIYMQEKRELLAVLTQGDPVLHKRATAIVDNYFLDNDK